MINIDFTNIDNAKLIGRLLPFWARGRLTSLLLQALLYPIGSIHRIFQRWALDTYIDYHITAQKATLEWYLKYKLRAHFLNEDDEFFIAHGTSDLNLNYATFNTGRWENDLPWSNYYLWQNDYEESIFGDKGFHADQTNVYAPAIVDTISYNHEDYERDIRLIMSKYLTNFKKINIVIAKS